MTAIAKPVHRSIAALQLPKTVSGLISYSTQITTAATGNPSFPNPTPTVAAIVAATHDLQVAQATALTRVKGAASGRNDKRALLVALLQQFKGYVQSVADGNIETGATVIHSAGLAVKKTPTRAPRIFAAKQGAVSGAAKVLAPSAGPRSSYEWEYSIDGGKTWVEAPPTVQAKTTVTGLVPGSTPQFRYRTVTKTGASDWSQPVTLLVK